MLRHLFLAALLFIAACAPAPQPVPAPPPPRVTGLDGVMGKDTRALAALFGDPTLDVHEGPARKLQFANGLCVLDLYLYPPAAGGIPVVTYADARRPTGEDFDRASCVAALARRPQAR